MRKKVANLQYSFGKTMKNPRGLKKIPAKKS